MLLFSAACTDILLLHPISNAEVRVWPGRGARGVCGFCCQPAVWIRAFLFQPLRYSKHVSVHGAHADLTISLAYSLPCATKHDISPSV